MITRSDAVDRRMITQLIAAIKMLLSRSHALGLTWNLRYGTISGAGMQAKTHNVPVILDGDTIAVRAISLIGVLMPTQRVAIIVVPPSSMFIVGTLTNDSTSVQDEQPTAVNTASVTYTATGTICGVAFVAPPNGKVWVHWNCEMQSDTDNAFCLAGWRIRTGSTVNSGTTVVDVNEDRRLTYRRGIGAAVTAGYGSSHLVTGLTPGKKYNIVHLVRVTAGTGTFNARRVGVAV